MELKIPYKEEFETFANTLGPDSFESYLKYLKAAYLYLCPQITVEFNGTEINGQYLFENIPHLFKNQSGRELVFLLLNILTELDRPDDSISAKYLSNIRTGLRWYLAFLSTDDLLKGAKDKGCIIGNATDCKTIIRALESKYKTNRSFFSKAALEKIFVARLLTQDRKGGNYAVELPIRKISKEISHHKKLKITLGKWFAVFIKDHLNFRTQNGIVPFKKVHSLTISDDGDVKIKVGKKSETVYFELNDSSELTTFKEYCKNKANKTEIRDLALDHDIPIFNVLLQYKDKLPILALFNTFDKNQHLSDDEALELYKEFTTMHEQTVNFTIMHQVENVKKGKKQNG